MCSVIKMQIRVFLIPHPVQQAFSIHDSYSTCQHCSNVKKAHLKVNLKYMMLIFPPHDFKIMVHLSSLFVSSCESHLLLYVHIQSLQTPWTCGPP